MNRILLYTSTSFVSLFLLSRISVELCQHVQFLPPKCAVHVTLSRFLVLQEHLVLPSITSVSIALCIVHILGDALSSERSEIQIEQIQNGTGVGRRLVRITE